ncbi:flagellin [Panacagrimonas perspica]|uniref:Flagellin n=1 Tax=Panacagrimonas perspica TaxID=381431 RepID=A0A4S3K1I7_9GAMM|nr:flagellin [Panacagrimonas perspica]TDU31027.1 flagellin [Panacagrimonas perspica]THD01827.1 flagellin [Panacagrimonas perspica]
MPQTINTNVMSLNAQRNLNTSQTSMATSLQRLSSGLRINSAKDDAAGLAITERFTTQIRGLDQAARNANDGISLAQTAEGALVEVSNNLQRIRELAVQSRNATNSASDRAALNTEAQALRAEIDRVASQTSFNGVNLLDGSFTNQTFQVGANAGQTINVASIVDASSANLGTYTSAQVTGVAATAFTAVTAGHLTIDGGNGNGAISVGGIGADTSATERAASVRTAVNSVSDQTGVYAVNDTATTVTLVSTTGAITIAHAGASSSTAITGLAAATTATTTSTGFATLDISSVAGADSAMRQMDAALSSVNSARASLGAVQNRFSSVVASLQTTSENLTSSRGRIQDADFAKETANLTRSQILQQAGTAMLAQANSAPQNVLSLLRG